MLINKITDENDIQIILANDEGIMLNKILGLAVEECDSKIVERTLSDFQANLDTFLEEE